VGGRTGDDPARRPRYRVSDRQISPGNPAERKPNAVVVVDGAIEGARRTIVDWRAAIIAERRRLTAMHVAVEDNQLNGGDLCRMIKIKPPTVDDGRVLNLRSSAGIRGRLPYRGKGRTSHRVGLAFECGDVLSTIGRVTCAQTTRCACVSVCVCGVALFACFFIVNTKLKFSTRSDPS